MKDYIVYNDLHIYGPHVIKGISLLDGGKNSIYLGDNIDINHCKKKRIGEAMEGLRLAKDIFKRRFVPGNHEIDAVPGNRFYIDQGIYFTHGDYEFWGKKKRNDYVTTATPGLGFWKRRFVKLYDILRRLRSDKVSDEFIERAVAVCKTQGCHTYVCGHRHPRKKIDFVHGKIRIIVLPRGRNELAL